MNYDRNGVMVTTSRPKPVLRKCYRVVTVDSRDRDPTKFVRTNGGASSSDPGDYVVYLPRLFQKVTRIRLMNAALLGVQPSDTYIMMQLEGLNRIDECAAGADRAGYVDSTFAKILNDRPVVATGAAYTYSQITGITNRVFSTPQSAVTSVIANATGTISVPGTGASVVYGGVTIASANLLVNTFITVSGFTGVLAYNGTFLVTANTTSTVTVSSTATGSPSGSGTISSNVTPIVSGSVTAVGDGTTIVYTVSAIANTFTNSMIGEVITVAGFTGSYIGYNGTFIVTANTTTTINVASTTNLGSSGSTAGITIAAPATYVLPLTVSSVTSSIVAFTTTQSVSTGTVVTVYGFTGASAVYNGTWTAANVNSTTFTIQTPLGSVIGSSGAKGFVSNIGGNSPITSTVIAATSSAAALTTNPTANALLTNITFAAPNTYTVGQNVNVSGYTGLWAALNGSYVVLSASSANFTVASSAPIPISAVTGSGTTQPTCLISAVGNGSSITYTFNGAHNINVGQTITVALSGQSSGPYMTGVITSVPSSSTLTMASTYNGTLIPGAATTVTVNNLQYSYITTITTSFVTGQYLVISGFTSPNTAANAAAQILQSSLSTGTSGTFETTNIANITAAGTAGTAIISQAIYYNDMSYAPNITYYNPPIGTLDRMHITLRRHLPLSSVTTTNPVNAPITFGPAENTFTFEIEYIDNVFEDVSSFETRLDNADYTPKFQV